MFKIKKIKTLVMAFVVASLGVVMIAGTQVAVADHDSCYENPESTPAEIQTCVNARSNAAKAVCSQTYSDPASIAACEGLYVRHYGTVPSDSPANPDYYSADCQSTTPNSGNCGIIAYLVTAIRVMSGLVGIVIVIMIAIGGIQFSAARDNPQAVADARNRIVNAVIALIIYIFSFAILQWLVPGGIL